MGVEPVQEYSQREARRDYTKAFKSFRAQREQARKLVDSIAARYPKIVYHQREKADLVQLGKVREALTLLNRERRSLKRNPAKEVVSFPLGCYNIFGEDSVCPRRVKTTLSCCFFKPYNVAKQVKQRTPWRYVQPETYLQNERYRVRSISQSVLSGEELQFLKLKLSLKIALFRNSSLLDSLISRLMSCPVPQMDVEGVVESTGSIKEVMSNVAMESEAIDEKGVPHAVQKGFSRLAVSVESQTFETLTNRWLHIGNYKWDTTQGFDSEVFRIEFPLEILLKHQDSQMAQILLTHRFFRCDLEIKVILNSSPFQVGMLVVDWIYGNPLDSIYHRNVITAMHRNHAKLSAGSSNNVIIEVPYQHFNAYLSNSTNECLIGSLSCRVLNTLRATSRVASQANLAVYVALKNIDAHGLISRTFGVGDIVHDGIQGQMMSTGELLNVGSNLLRTAGNIFNQDKPPLPLQPVALVPQSVQSFAHTDGIAEPINVLRSDPRGQRPGLFDGSQMTLSTLSNCWGFCGRFEWGFGNVVGETLFQTDVQPLWPQDKYRYMRRELAPGVFAIPYPPVAVLASLASKCRGDIEFRFEIVANGFYTGSLQISSVPLCSTDDVELSQAVLSCSQITDIRTTSEIVFCVPWNWYNAWMRTPSLQNPEGQSFAKLFVKVLNPLIAIDSVPTKISVNVYVRGGSNFEVCQFRTPTLSLMLDVIVPPKGQYLEPYNFETKWYMTSCKDTKSSSGASLCVPYIQNVTNGWVGYLNVVEFKIYELSTVLNNGFEFRIMMNAKGRSGFVKYGVWHSGLATSNAHGLVCFTTIATTRGYVKHVKTYGYGADKLDLFLSAYPDAQYVSDGPWSEIRKDATQPWYPADNVSGQFPIWTSYVDSIETNVIGQMDTGGVVTQLEKQAPSSVYGTSVYGEKMPDMKGMARRWQHYGSFVGNTCISKYPRDCRFLFKFPVRPQRPLNPQSSVSYDNRIRDGLMPLMSELFAFWDGGMRYRFVLTHNIPEATIYVQHRFDDESIGNAILVPSGPLTSADLLDTHYPTFVQALSVNPILTVEVPYMRSQERLLTQSKARPKNNGYMYVWIHSPVVEEAHVEVYYSAADDFQWSVFQGVPQLLDITQIAPEPQGDTDSFTSEIYCDDRPMLSPYFGDRVIEDEPKLCTRAQGLFDWLGVGDSTKQVKDTLGGVQETAKKVSDGVDVITTHFENVSLKMSSLLNKISGVPTELSQAQKDRVQRGGLGNLMDDFKHASFDYLTHLIYCAINPNGKTVAWAIVNIYRNVWGFTTNGLSEMVQPLVNLWERCVMRASKQPQPVGQMEDADITSLCSVVYCSLCSLVKLAVRPPISWSNISVGLFDFSTSCRSGSIVAKFFSDNLELVRRIWRKILSFFSFKTDNFNLISGVKDKRLQEWCIHSTAILNPAIREKIYLNPLWAEKAFELSVVGRAIVLTLSSDKTVPSNLMRIINDNLIQLRKLEFELVNRKVFSGERYEPFCLWIAGGAGTGKTRLMQTVAGVLADVVSSNMPSTYHTITINQQYFDGFVGQPSILIDDFLAVCPSMDSTAALFLQMKSSALFNPPYSDVKDKAKTVNFYNLLITSNFYAVDNLPGIHDSSAYNRRRDLLLSCTSLPYRLGQTEWSLEDYEKLLHVDVWYHPNPLEFLNKSKIERVEGVDYSSTIMKFIREKAVFYHQREAESYRKRALEKQRRLDLINSASSLSAFLGDAEKVYKSLNQPFDLFKKWMQPFEVTSETKDSIVSETKSGLSSDTPLISLEPIYGSLPNNNNAGSLSVNDSDLILASRNIVVQADVINPSTPSVSEDIIGQGESEIYFPYWPKEFLNVDDCIPERAIVYRGEITRLIDITPLQVIEPLKRVNWPPIRCTYRCLHSMIRNHNDYIYDSDLRAFVHMSGVGDYLDRIPHSYPVGTCIMLDLDRNIIPDLNCIMLDTRQRERFIGDSLNNFINNSPEFASRWRVGDLEGFDVMEEEYPHYYISEAVKTAQFSIASVQLNLENASLKRRIQKLQEKVSSGGIEIDEQILPVESKWKTIPRLVWKGFLKMASWVSKVLKVLERFVHFLTGLALVGVFTAGAYAAYNSVPIGNLHPSGDFKTVKNRSSNRVNALNLLKPQVNIECDSVENVDNDTLTKLCAEVFIDPSVDGRLRKIISNTFTLVGIKPLDNGKSTLFRARCLGLRNYDFICMKHYIDHFKECGVESVAIVYRGALGVQRFKFSELVFNWTEEGYGIGTFPVLARTFKSITKMIPRQSFDGNYPQQMIMVEVFVDDVKYHNLECVKLTQDVYVPQNRQQRSWTITRGFNYLWGGAGKCGSFLFAPQMACPLVGIHTAGVADRLGYSEMLLRETFEDENVVEVEFVEPQMSLFEGGLDMPGDALVVGHLNKNKSINLPSKTKIMPSEISGVFPVRTQPAPLSKNDERIDFDPLIEGLKKRCDKPLEFPKELVDEAVEDFRKVILTIKPLRNPGRLAVSEAVEGFELKGYDSMEMSTSEGYPWVLDRPKGKSDKSWMFKMDVYPDGRKKLEGIIPDLREVLDLKHKMRLRNLVPATYFTACLKDARILTEKVDKPGKTRLFEMSPVDLTIVQRQYYLDFYASYQFARLEAENTIGINPDGPEWTMLARSLLEFSPYILTADYSGYGPRLHQSIQFRAYDIENDWYKYNQRLNGVDEVEIIQDSQIRNVLKYEMLHPLTVVKNVVVRFNTGMASGNAGTVVKNSECNSIYIRIIFLYLANKFCPQYSSLFYFRLFVRMYSNGDDLIMAVKEEILEWFNNRTIIEAFKDFGIVMTDALKSDGLVREWCTLDQATYLKRGFLSHPIRKGHYLAPLEEISIMDTANWIWRSVDNRAASLVNSEMAVRLAYTRGSDFYNLVASRIGVEWLLRRVIFRYPSWHCMDLSVWEDINCPPFTFN
uniref:Genome polyprotein n=1 Tax=Suncus murinus ribovirus 6 TaxID=3139580 RepID=A0AB38ZKJ7_9VIRU